LFILEDEEAVKINKKLKSTSELSKQTLCKDSNSPIEENLEVITCEKTSMKTSSHEEILVEDDDSLAKTLDDKEFTNNNFNESDDDVIECSSEDEDIIEIKQNGSSGNQINSVSQKQHQLLNRVNLNKRSKENSENDSVKNGCIQIE